MKKFICTVCGYIHEGDAAPEKCPLCKAPASKFNEMVETEGGLEFADQHVIGVAKGCDEEMIKDLNNHLADMPVIRFGFFHYLLSVHSGGLDTLTLYRHE